MASSKNCTTLRLLHYPCLPDDKIIKPGQIRCGEHTDYGSITLLFQDNMPGLEVSWLLLLIPWRVLSLKLISCQNDSPLFQYITCKDYKCLPFIMLIGLSRVQFGLWSYEWQTKSDNSTQPRDQLIKTMATFEKETKHRLYNFIKKSNRYSEKCTTTASAHDAKRPLLLARRAHCSISD